MWVTNGSYPPCWHRKLGIVVVVYELDEVVRGDHDERILDEEPCSMQTLRCLCMRPRYQNLNLLNPRLGISRIGHRTRANGSPFFWAEYIPTPALVRKSYLDISANI